MIQYTTVERVLSALKLETPDFVTKAAIGDEITAATDTAIAIMLFEFDGDTTVVYLDGPGDTMLYLPAPGAQDVTSVVEDGVVLDPALYFHEPRLGRYLMRLDALGNPTWWTSNPRAIAVTFTPNTHPPAVERIVLAETVRGWNARQAGYPELIGVQGSNARPARNAFAEESVKGLERIAGRYNIRDTIAI
jgi:hypothetical protein